MKYVQKKYKHKNWIPFNLAKQALEEKWERALVFYLQLKKIHTKPIFYNFSLQSIANEMNCSPSNVKRNLDILVSKSLVSIHNTGRKKHLHLTGVNSLLKQYGSFLIPVQYNVDKKKQLTYLRYVVIKRNFILQYRAYQVSSNIIKYHQGKLKKLTPKQVKGLLKQEKRKNALTKSTVEQTIRDKFVLSNKKIGTLSNRSMSTGLKIQKDLNNLKLIKSTASLRILNNGKKTSRREFHHIQSSSAQFLSNKGYMYRRLPNNITILQ